MVPLPIDASLPEIVARLRDGRSLVLVAAPGAGKTTRVPPAVLRAGLLDGAHPNLVMLQPRRVAARASAQRIAEENDWTLGREVGYHVRFDRKIGRDTRLRVLTEGILTRQLLDDPFLEGVGCVILDEFHERNIHTDLCIALLREVQQTVREDLILIVMSATLDAEPISRFLGGCPIIRSEGRTFPVEIQHAGWSQDRIADRAADAVIDVLTTFKASAATRPYSSAGVPEEVKSRTISADGQTLAADARGDIRSIDQSPLPSSILVSPSSGTPGEGRGGGSVGNLASTTANAARAAQPPPFPSPGVPEEGKRVAGTARGVEPERAAGPSFSSHDPGDVLVFLPGVEEIRRTMARLESFAREHNLLLLPLHGSLPPEDQMLALRPAKQRKVICATNIAETSLTIAGVRTVIDSGVARIAGYDPQRGLDRLELSRISRASATQRTGRAGRTAPGRCIRLWSLSEEKAMAAFQPAEICRVDLCQTVLMLHAWGKTDLRGFGWFDPPPELMLQSAERLLTMLGALTRETDGQITPLGRRLMQVPAHPRLARLLLEAVDNDMLEEGAAIAALLSEKDITWEDRSQRPWERQAKTIGSSDLLIRLDLLKEAEKARFALHLRDAGIDPVAARQAAKVRDELKRIVVQAFQPARQKSQIQIPALLEKLPLLAYPDRVCRRRESDPAAATMVGGGGVRLAAESIVRHPEFFLALDARQDERSPTREALVRIASAIEVSWLEELFPASVRRERGVVFDSQRQRVVGFERTWYRDLLLKEDSNVQIDPEQAAVALAAAVRPMVRELFAADEPASNLLARVALLRRHLPEQQWPAFDDAELGDLLAEAAAGKRSLDEVRRVPLAPLLMQQLPYPLDRLLDQHAPDKVTVSTGNAIRLDYTGGAAPVLAVRLQEIFGWTDTPRIAAGRIPVLLHLLGPNYRPVQITDDLRSFWSGTYFQVRKDLRVRYPKHSWPEDPLTATPQAKGSRRRSQ